MSDRAQILDRLLSSETKGHILVLFHKNPGLIDTVDGLARRIGRTGAAIEADIKDLEALGLFRRKQVGKFEVISFSRSRDREIQGMIEDHLKSLKV